MRKSKTGSKRNISGRFFSSDGGRSWQLRWLPFSGPVRFISPSVGWTTGSCCTGAPTQLHRTTDGGLTWQQQQVAPNPVENDGDYHDYALPVFQNQEEGVLAITLRDQSHQISGVGFYRTSDAGQSWQLAATFQGPGQEQVRLGGTIPAQILDTDRWIVAWRDGLYVTRDGGGTWDQFIQAGLPGFHHGLQYATQDLGWSLVFEDNCGQACLLLFKSADGGRSWSALPVDNGAAQLP